MAKKWMRKAFENSHGQLKDRAKAVGKPVAEFAAEHAHSRDKHVAAQSRLALVGMGKDIPDRPAPKPVAERRYGKNG